MPVTPSYLKSYCPLGNMDQVGSVNQSSVSGTGIIKAYHYGISTNFYRTILALDDYRVLITHTTTGIAAPKLYDFPEGRIQILGGTATLQYATRTVITSTLNAGVTVNISLGSAATADTTLSGSEVDIMASTSTTSPSVIDTYNTAVNAGLAAVTLDGTSTPSDIYLNVAVPTDADIDGDATVGFRGWINFLWTNHGDYLDPTTVASFMAGVAGNP